MYNFETNHFTVKTIRTTVEPYLACNVSSEMSIIDLKIVTFAFFDTSLTPLLFF